MADFYSTVVMMTFIMLDVVAIASSLGALRG